MEESRAYVYTRVKKLRVWAFVPLLNIETTLLISRLPLESWVTEDGEVYKLYACCYNDAETENSMREYEKAVKTEDHQTGPILYQLVCITTNIVMCHVTKPFLMHSVRLQYNGRDFRVVSERVTFDELKKEMCALLRISVPYRTIHRHLIESFSHVGEDHDKEEASPKQREGECVDRSP